MPASSWMAHYFLSLRGILRLTIKSTKSFTKNLMIVGLTLAALRKNKGYATIKEFAQQYDLPEIQYWRIENGKANITLKSLVKILSIHSITLQDFFCAVVFEEHSM